MAQIDLRHAKIYFIDGFTKIGAINEPTPANSDTSFGIDGVTGILPIGLTFTVVGSTRRYTITDVVGGATPTEITFSPPLATADGIPLDNAVITFGPNILEVKIGEGNLTFEEKRNINYVREKKSIDNGFVMTGDDEPMDVSLDFIWEFLSSEDGNPPTPKEALTKTGPAASWVTSGGDKCEPYATDIEVIYEPPCEGVPGERILLSEFRWESLSQDLKAATIGAKGKCKVLLAIANREDSPITP